jgi:ABC-type branched-subunit amino acid transport system ATPase component
VLSISKNKTIVLVEHNTDMVLQVSNFITVLHQGAVIAEGSPDEVQKDPFVQEAYLGGYKLTTAR